MAAVASLARTLRALARVPSQVSAPLATFITGRLRAGILGGTDPYGNPFAPLAASTVRKKGHARILQETLTLLGTVAALAMQGGGVALDAGPSYGRYAFPERPYLPINVLPATWRAELQRLLHERVKAGLR